MPGIALSEITRLATGLADNALDVLPTVLMAFLDANLVLVQEVFLSAGKRGQVGHDDIGRRIKGFFPPLGAEAADSRRGSDIDIRGYQPEQGPGVQTPVVAFLLGRNPVPVLPERSLRMLDIRPHAHHVHIHLLEEIHVLHHLLRSLERQTDHDAAAHLIAGIAQALQTVEPCLEQMVGGMQTGVELGRRGLDAEQVTNRSSLFPSGVGLWLLFPQGEGDAQLPAALLHHGIDQFLYVPDESLVLAFPRLQHQRTETGLMGETGGLQHLVLAHCIAVHSRIAAPDPAIIAVLAADIGILYQGPQIHLVAHVRYLDFMRRLTQLPRFLPGAEQPGKRLSLVFYLQNQRILSLTKPLASSISTYKHLIFYLLIQDITFDSVDCVFLLNTNLDINHDLYAGGIRKNQDHPYLYGVGGLAAFLEKR